MSAVDKAHDETEDTGSYDEDDEGRCCPAGGWFCCSSAAPPDPEGVEEGSANPMGHAGPSTTTSAAKTPRTPGAAKPTTTPGVTSPPTPWSPASPEGLFSPPRTLVGRSAGEWLKSWRAKHKDQAVVAAGAGGGAVRGGDGSFSVTSPAGFSSGRSKLPPTSAASGRPPSGPATRGRAVAQSPMVRRIGGDGVHGVLVGHTNSAPTGAVVDAVHSAAVGATALVGALKIALTEPGRRSKSEGGGDSGTEGEAPPMSGRSSVGPPTSARDAIVRVTSRERLSVSRADRARLQSVRSASSGADSPSLGDDSPSPFPHSSPVPPSSPMVLPARAPSPPSPASLYMGPLSPSPPPLPALQQLHD